MLTEEDYERLAKIEVLAGQLRDALQVLYGEHRQPDLSGGHKRRWLAAMQKAEAVLALTKELLA